MFESSGMIIISQNSPTSLVMYKLDMVTGLVNLKTAIIIQVHDL